MDFPSRLSWSKHSHTCSGQQQVAPSGEGLRFGVKSWKSWPCLSTALPLGWHIAAGGSGPTQKALGGSKRSSASSLGGCPMPWTCNDFLLEHLLPPGADTVIHEFHQKLFIWGTGTQRTGCPGEVTSATPLPGQLVPLGLAVEMPPPAHRSCVLWELCWPGWR